MTAPNCRHYQTCNAPICPEDAGSMANCTWFADEDVCQRASVPGWVKRQRRIAKKLAHLEWKSGYFSVEMLKRPFAVVSGLRGLDPDREHGAQLERWLEGHQGRKPLSAEKKAELASRLPRNTGSGRAISSQKDGLAQGFEG